jgi:3-hydroxy-9,10-secoandrosta-1,3,5(10)-triene-9,17-dione monooxygenase
MTYHVDLGASMIGPTPGSRLHGDALYGGLFAAFAEGGLSAMATGTAYAAIDEYETIIKTKTTPGTTVLRAENPDFQRTLGIAIALADCARAITLQGADQFLEGAEASVANESPFTPEMAARIDGMYHCAEKLAYDAVEALLRTSSSLALKDGQPLPRYFRDLITLRTRGHDQFEFRAAAIAKPRL